MPPFFCCIRRTTCTRSYERKKLRQEIIDRSSIIHNTSPRAGTHRVHSLTACNRPSRPSGKLSVLHTILCTESELKIVSSGCRVLLFLFLAFVRCSSVVLQSIVCHGMIQLLSIHSLQLFIQIYLLSTPSWSLLSSWWMRALPLSSRIFPRSFVVEAWKLHARGSLKEFFSWNQDSFIKFLSSTHSSSCGAESRSFSTRIPSSLGWNRQLRVFGRSNGNRKRKSPIYIHKSSEVD